MTCIAMASYKWLFLCLPRLYIPHTTNDSFSFCGGKTTESWNKRPKGKNRVLRERTPKKAMALKLSLFTSQPPKLPSFALQQKSTLRSPKFFMASTLSSASKWVSFSRAIHFFFLSRIISGSLCCFLFWSCFWIWVFVFTSYFWLLSVQMIDLWIVSNEFSSFLQRVSISFWLWVLW